LPPRFATNSTANHHTDDSLRFLQSGIEIPHKKRKLALGIEDLQKNYAPTIYHDLTSMFEVHRYPFANIRLHLAKPPIGAIRMAHNHTGL
jgi:hypothetical protein